MNEVVVAQPKTPVLAGGGVSAIVPKSIDEAWRVSEGVFMAGMYPDDCKAPTPKETTARIMMKILKGTEVGFPPMTALGTILIVNNRTAIWGDGALALVVGNRAYGGHREWTSGDQNTSDKSTWSAHCEITRIVDGKPIITTRSFGWSDVLRASLARKGTYQQYPGRMIQMRARAWCIRDSFADALCGLGIVEEVRDLPEKPAEVSTAFLDSPTPAIAAPAETVETQTTEPPTLGEPEVTEFDPAAYMKAVKKNFVKAGDDKAAIKQIIEAAEGQELPEPFNTELREILAAKRKKIE